MWTSRRCFADENRVASPSTVTSTPNNDGQGPGQHAGTPTRPTDTLSDRSHAFPLSQKRRVADSDAEEESSGSATDYEDRRAHKTQKKSAGKKKDSRKAGKGKGKGKRRARDDSDDEEEEEATDSSDDEGAGKGKKGELTEDVSGGRGRLWCEAREC